MLIDQEDSAIFMQDTIRICIEFLWKNYFWEIFRRNFLYFVAYLIVFLVVSMFLFDKNSHRETIEIVIAYIIEFLLIIASFQGLYIEFM